MEHDRQFVDNAVNANGGNCCSVLVTHRCTRALKHNYHDDSYGSDSTDFRAAIFSCCLQLHKRSDRKNKVLTQGSHLAQYCTLHWNGPYLLYSLIRSLLIRYFYDFPSISWFSPCASAPSIGFVRCKLSMLYPIDASGNASGKPGNRSEIRKKPYF